MTVSVIIPTYNGAHKIMGVLRSLAQQSQLPDEVIVVIDGSTDNTAHYLRQQEIKLPGFKIVEQENKGRAAVRNRGAQEAKGDLLIFLDDDMLADKDLVAQHQRAHSQNPEKIVTGKLQDVAKEQPTDFEQFRWRLTQKWNASLEDSKGLQPLQHTYLTAGNLSLRKKTFTTLAGFDERLNDAEDFDLATRARAAHIPLYYAADAIALHNDNQHMTCVDYIRRQQQYQEAHKLLSRLKPELYGSQTAYSIRKHAGWKSVVMRFFRQPFWSKWVDQGVLKMLPKKWRYKLYDVIITARSR